MNLNSISQPLPARVDAGNGTHSIATGHAKKDHRRAGYPEIEFGGFSDVDGSIRFFSRVAALLTSDAVVVDFGCGRGAHVEDPVVYRRNIRNFRGRVGRVIGVDLDRVGVSNPTIDEFRLLPSDGIWPIESSSVDMVLSSFVMEHLPDPDLFFSEAARVLRKGGYVCLRTPNIWGYVAIAARLIPERLHKKVLKRAQPERLEETSSQRSTAAIVSRNFGGNLPSTGLKDLLTDMSRSLPI